MTKPKWQIKAEVFSSPALLLKPVWNRNVEGKKKKNPEEENRPGQEKAREEMRVERTNKRIFSFGMFFLTGKKGTF